MSESRGCLRSKASEGEAVVVYREPSAMKTPKASDRRSWGIIGFPAGQIKSI
jgi:hypothetical protein